MPIFGPSRFKGEKILALGFSMSHISHTRIETCMLSYIHVKAKAILFPLLLDFSSS